VIPYTLQIAADRALIRVSVEGLKHMNKSNARFRGRGRSPQWKKTAEYERALARGFAKDFTGKPIAERDLIVIIELELGRQKTANGAMRKAKTRAKLCDVDGVKAILDAGNGVLWIDDQQIGTLVVRKMEHANGAVGDRVTVSVFTRPKTEKVDKGNDGV